MALYYGKLGYQELRALVSSDARLFGRVDEHLVLLDALEFSQWPRLRHSARVPVSFPNGEIEGGVGDLVIAPIDVEEAGYARVGAIEFLDHWLIVGRICERRVRLFSTLVPEVYEVALATVMLRWISFSRVDQSQIGNTINQCLTHLLDAENWWEPEE